MSNGPKQNKKKPARKASWMQKTLSYRCQVLLTNSRTLSQETRIFVLNCFSKVQIQLKFQIQFSWLITYRLTERRISRNSTYSILLRRSVCSTLIEVWFSSKEHQLHHPPLPPILFFVFLSTLASQFTENIVFLVFVVVFLLEVPHSKKLAKRET